MQKQTRLDFQSAFEERKFISNIMWFKYKYSSYYFSMWKIYLGGKKGVLNSYNPGHKLLGHLPFFAR